MMRGAFCSLWWPQAARRRVSSASPVPRSRPSPATNSGLASPQRTHCPQRLPARWLASSGRTTRLIKSCRARSRSTPHAHCNSARNRLRLRVGFEGIPSRTATRICPLLVPRAPTVVPTASLAWSNPSTSAPIRRRHWQRRGCAARRRLMAMEIWNPCRRRPDPHPGLQWVLLQGNFALAYSRVYSSAGDKIGPVARESVNGSHTTCFPSPLLAVLTAAWPRGRSRLLIVAITRSPHTDVGARVRRIIFQSGL